MGRTAFRIVPGGGTLAGRRGPRRGSATMKRAGTVRGHAVVVQPEDGPSYWQPVLARGLSRPKLFPALDALRRTGHGLPDRRPRGRIREHSHGEQVDSQICFAARAGWWSMAPAIRSSWSTACFLARTSGTRSSTRRRGPGHDLDRRAPGLERFSSHRPAPAAGVAPPAPFERSSDVVAIERALGLNAPEKQTRLARRIAR